MTAHILVSCPDHRTYAGCDDDAWYTVETAAAALALHGGPLPRHHRPEDGASVDRLRDRRVPQPHLRDRHQRDRGPRPGVGAQRRLVPGAAGGRLVGGCQWHLGTCCIHHAALHPDSLTHDRSAVLPAVGQPTPGPEPVQLDLFAPRAA